MRKPEFGVLFLQGLLRPALHPARLPPAAPLGPGTSHIIMLSNYGEFNSCCLEI
jgi:hypothetical protein